MAKYKKSTLMLWAAIILIVVLGCVYFLAHKYFVGDGLKKSSSKAPAAAAAPPTPSVTVTKLQEHTIPQVVSSYGSTVSPNTAVVAAKTAGVISGIYFKAGANVSKGQLLFHIVSTDISEQMQKLKADLANAKYTYNSYLQANKEVPGTVSKSDLTKAQTDYEGALAAYQAAKKEVFVTSPIDGIATDTDLAVGNSVQEAQQLVSIVSNKDLQIKYTLPSQYANAAKVGQQITFKPNNSQAVYKATVVYVSSELNAVSDNITLRANFDSPTDVSANLFGQVQQVLNPEHKAITVPQVMVQSDEQGFYLYIVKDQKVAKAYIKPGSVTEKGYVEIQSTWDPNTEVISSDVGALSVGQKVKVKTS